MAEILPPDLALPPGQKIIHQTPRGLHHRAVAKALVQGWALPGGGGGQGVQSRGQIALKAKPQSGHQLRDLQLSQSLLARQSAQEPRHFLRSAAHHRQIVQQDLGRGGGIGQRGDAGLVQIRRQRHLGGQKDQNRAHVVQRKVDVTQELLQNGFADLIICGGAKHLPPHLGQDDLERVRHILGLTGLEATQNRHRPGARKRFDRLCRAKTGRQSQADQQLAGGDRPGCVW